MLRCASFFAGVGGIDKGFEQTGFFKTVYANEFDPYPAATFQRNFEIAVDCRDIHEVKSSEIPDLPVFRVRRSVSQDTERASRMKKDGELFFLN